MSQSSDCAEPTAIEAMVNSPRPTLNVRRRPNRSPGPSAEQQAAEGEQVCVLNPGQRDAREPERAAATGSHVLSTVATDAGARLAATGKADATDMRPRALPETQKIAAARMFGDHRTLPEFYLFAGIA
jgi:hypothetical protein